MVNTKTLMLHRESQRIRSNTSRQLHFCLATLLTLTASLLGDEPLDSLLENVHPEIRKWASVIRVSNPKTRPKFTSHHYLTSEHAVDFWPASTIKLYTVVASLEWLNEQGLSEDTTLTFSHKNQNQEWVIDCARTYSEMVSEVFRRSSNEDYTLLLRTLGIDAINTRFLIPDKGFPHSALMRDYITHRPAVYENEEDQRIQASSPEGIRKAFEHQWSGISYSQQRGASVLSAETGNCTSTAELANCLRRLLFHEQIPKEERFEISARQARWICEGDPKRGITGLENRLAGPYGWQGSGALVFPNARYFHKAGLISSYALDLCYISDSESDHHLILALAAQSGKEPIIRDMALAIYQAAKSGAF